MTVKQVGLVVSGKDVSPFRKRGIVIGVGCPKSAIGKIGPLDHSHDTARLIGRPVHSHLFR